jgi:VanZ family protein
MSLLGLVRDREFKWRQRRPLPRPGIFAFHSRPKTVFLGWIIVLVCVSVGELLPGSSGPVALLSSANVSDKVLHGSAYGLLALLPAFGFRLPAALGFAFATELIGIALEFAQLRVPDRSYDPFDMLANTVGVLVGLTVGRSLCLLMNLESGTPPESGSRHPSDAATGMQVPEQTRICKTGLICQDNQG